MGRRAGIYVRISDDRKADRAGVRRQLKDLEALCAEKDWTVAEDAIYDDNDITGTGRKNRPAFQRMLRDIESGSINAVVVGATDRLGRNWPDALEFMNLCREKGVALAGVLDTGHDLSTAAGRRDYVSGINAGVYESERMSERIRRGHKQRAEEGRSSGGGDRPFGYEEDRKTIRLKEAALIKQASQRILAGDSLRSIAKEWNTKGIKSVTGNSWSVMVLKRMLRSARIAGLREHKDVGPVKAEWPGIITPDTRDRLKAILDDPHRQRNKEGPGRKYLLTGGLGFCELCAAPLVARPTATARSYVCATGPGYKGCGKIRCEAEPLEEHVRDSILEALAGPKLAKMLRAASGEDQQQAALLEELETLRHKRDQHARDYADDVVDREAYIALNKELNSRIEAVNRHLASSNGTRTLATLPATEDALREAWDARGLDWRRALVGAVVEKVVVGPAVKGKNFFDPDRVAITWRA